MNRYVFLFILSLIFQFKIELKGQPWKIHGKLTVSSTNKHFIQYEDGTPFFWLGDTGWEMLHRLNRDEIVSYLENRSKKGFNVIQTVLVSEFIRMDKPTNYYKDSIFVDENPLKPFITKGNNPENAAEYDYWDHVDFAVKTAESKGLYLALVATWGEWVIPRSEKPLFNTNDQAYGYGWFLGNRYKNATNIIWILGGDRHPDERANGIELWRSMAEGIADGANGEKKMDGKANYSTTLMTHHAYNSSSTWFQNDKWIDFHCWGSYHAEYNNTRSYELALADYKLPNPKPTINSEPCYEGHGVNYAVDDNGIFTSTDIRIAAYWSVFSGSFGFTYGAQPIWQFTDANRRKFSKMTFSTWQEALDLPGAEQSAILKDLMLKMKFQEMVPDQSVIIEGEGKSDQRACALRSKSTLMVYIPTGNSPKIKLGSTSGEKIKASWFNPRNGETNEIGQFINSGEKSFEVPGMSKELSWLKSGRGCDWVLIIEDNSIK